MTHFTYLESAYRTNDDASTVERLNAVSGAWTATHSLGVRAAALAAVAAAKVAA